MVKNAISRPFLVAAAAGLLLIGVQCAFAQSRSDSQIQADVNSKLQSDPNLSNVAIGVGVQNGVVTLTGNVAGDAQLTEAENDISGIQGITKIVDNMQVNNANAPAANAAPGTQNEAAQSAQTTPPPPQPNQQGNYTYNNPQQDNVQDQGEAQGQANLPPPGQQQAGNVPPPAPNGSYSPPQPPPESGYGPGYGPGQGNYGNNPPRRRPARYDPGNRQVTLPMGSVITVRTLDPIVAGKTPEGAFFKGVVAQDIMGDQGVAIPRGAAVTGQVVESKKGGAFKGAADLKLKLTSLTLGDQSIPVNSDVWNLRAPGKGGATAGNAIGGAALGAIIGGIAGRGTGAAIGAGAGAVAGGASTGLSGSPRDFIPPEGLVTFRLLAPVTVTTIPPAQAKLLANAAPPMPPNRAPGPPPGYYRPYPYAYPPPPPPGYYPY